MRSSKTLLVCTYISESTEVAELGPSSANRPPVVHICSSSNAEFALFQAETKQIEALSGKGLHSLIVSRPGDDLPPACAVFPVSATVAVYLEVEKPSPCFRSN